MIDDICFKDLTDEELKNIRVGYLREKMRRKKLFEQDQNMQKQIKKEMARQLAESLDKLDIRELDIEWKLLAYLSGMSIEIVKEYVGSAEINVTLSADCAWPVGYAIRVHLVTFPGCTNREKKEQFKKTFNQLIDLAASSSDTLEGYELDFTGGLSDQLEADSAKED